VEFLRVASGAAATSLAVLTGDEDSLSPRARALARLATTLTAQPWEFTGEIVKDAIRQGLDPDHVEAAIGVVAMFNYFTRVADASGIEFDYQSPLPAFQPDLGQTPAARPERPSPAATGSPPGGSAATAAGSSGSAAGSAATAAGSAGLAAGSAGLAGGGDRLPCPGPMRTAWETWRSYVLGEDEPISRDERRLLARVAAEESGDWAGAEELGADNAGGAADLLVAFARKLSRQPWCMRAEDLETLRAGGYSEPAILHVISVVAHQNATSRLALGLAAR